MFFVIAFAVLFLPMTLLYPTKVIYKNRLDKKKKCIIACNHFSNADSIILDVKFGKKFRFLGKKELFKTKFSSWIMRHLGVISVDREKVAPSTFKEILSALNNNEQILIYPEGTRNKSGTDDFQGAKDGLILFASKGDAEIVPMLIYKKPKIFRKNYIIVGESFKVQGENPKKLTKEETEFNLAKYSQIMVELRDELEKKIHSKKRIKNSDKK